jgi:hypothetical protein
MVLAADFQVGFRSSAMPHFEQSPGLSDSMPGHIGQKYLASAAGVTAACSWDFPPQQDGVAVGGAGAFGLLPQQLPPAGSGEVGERNFSRQCSLQK